VGVFNGLFAVEGARTRGGPNKEEVKQLEKKRKAEVLKMGCRWEKSCKERNDSPLTGKNTRGIHIGSN